MTINSQKYEKQVLDLFDRSFLPLSRFAIFIIYFWFGILKVLDLSPATPLAYALIASTVGHQYFNYLFAILGVFECILGILFLFPKAIRASLILLFAHMLIVCSPLILVADLAWDQLFVPSLEGQYIIKNIALIALAIGIAVQTNKIAKKH